MLSFKSKALTLLELQDKLTSATVLPMLVLNTNDKFDCEQIYVQTINKLGCGPYIVRSSSCNEDTANCSNAGKFLSIANVQSKDELYEAIEQVKQSMDIKGENYLFIQPYLNNVDICGVVFTLEPNTGGNYYVLNYDDTTGSTSSVTDGSGRNLKTLYHYKQSPIDICEPFSSLLKLCAELESLYETANLDIEFAYVGSKLYLLQVRPLVMRQKIFDLNTQTKILGHIENKIKQQSQPHPNLYGSYAIYGVMPDWNPAEMIGIRPKPLALSLYKEIITNGVWAYQRDNYGYQNLRSFALMLDFYGMPYIDARISFNSFVPKNLPDDLSQKLVNFYLDRLKSNPHLHDKIEFEIAITCYSFDIDSKLQRLDKSFTHDDLANLKQSLLKLTNSIIKSNGLWTVDRSKVELLSNKALSILQSSLPVSEKIYWLLEYCKRYGTLPFAGLARAAFIAVELLRSLVCVGILSESDKDAFMGELSTVAKNMSHDYSTLSKQSFYKKYGHLRPGTYDICSMRYDHKGDEYFANSIESSIKNTTKFKLSLEQIASLDRLINEHHLDTDVLSLFNFIKGAIEGRELAKFVFTKTLSDVIELIAQLGEEYGLSREELSYVDIRALLDTNSSICDIKQCLLESIAQGKAQDKILTSICLPPLIYSSDQVYSFSLQDDSPNFITQKSVTAPIALLPYSDISGKIALINGADPGYDWIFAHNIAGLITAYGGANSHMSIRAAEFELPAVIGVGEKLFNKYKNAKALKIDCRNKQISLL